MHWCAAKTPSKLTRAQAAAAQAALGTLPAAPPPPPPDGVVALVDAIRARGGDPPAEDEAWRVPCALWNVRRGESGEAAAARLVDDGAKIKLAIGPGSVVLRPAGPGRGFLAPPRN